MKKILWSVSAPVLVVILVLVGGGWYFSDQIRGGALEVEHAGHLPDLEVVEISGDRVMLQTMPDTKSIDWQTDGLWGLEWDNGYAQVGDIIELKETTVVREYFPLIGELQTGDKVRIDSFAFPGDPLQAHGIAFKDIYYSSAIGDFRAWYIEGSRDVWAIFVHGGLGATRREALPVLPVLNGLDLPTLVITYRNDEGAPQNPDGYYRYGSTEWADLEGAVEYALRHGAEGVLLIGNSMGGAIVMEFLYESPLAEKVRGVILDSPMLDFSSTIDHGADQRTMPLIGTPVPSPIIWIAKRLSSVRFGVDFDKLDYVSRADELDVPVLLFQGDADKMVPVELADHFAKTRPDIVRYVRNTGIGHVHTWNMLRSEYEAAVLGFIAEILH
jgi:pimeloyl-ACP methyl ester carboxylesterase